MRRKITDEFVNDKVYSRNDVAKLFIEFYEQVKHGDDEHQKWLKDETYKFIHDTIGKKDEYN